MLRRCLLLVAATALACPAAEPLPMAGEAHRTVVAALAALRRGDERPVRDLPHLPPEDQPALADPADPDLARRWTELVDPGLRPGPAAPSALSAAVAFDQGRLIDVLLLGGDDARTAAARTLLGLESGGGLPAPALPMPGAGTPPVPSPTRLARGDGWLFGLDATGAVRWQRRLERLAQVALGDDGALVAEAAGLAHVGLDGRKLELPPLPAFAKPLGTHGRWAWFHAGAQAWRFDLTERTAAAVALSAAPLGPPLQRGADAWWLTATEVVTTRGATVAERMPHLLPLSLAAVLAPHPRGAVVRDGPRWWLMTGRDGAPAAVRIESLLLGGHRTDAAALLATTPDVDHDLAVRVTLADPRTDQQRALVALATDRTALDGLPGNPLLCELGTDLALPVSAWPHWMTLAAWKSRTADRERPDIRISSDGVSVTVRAMWSEERWWERRWPMRPLLDAPGRSWALVPNALAVVDGANHLLLADERTGARIVACDLPIDIEPTLVARRGDHGAAVLAELGRSLYLIDGDQVRTIAVPGSGRKLIDGAVELADGSRWPIP